MQTRICRILAIIPAAGAASVIRTDRWGDLTLPTEERLAWLADVRARDARASICFDPDTRTIARVGPAKRDVVSAVVTEEDRTVVALKRRPTTLTLLKSDPRYPRLLALVLAAEKTKTPIFLGLQPGDDVLEDVVVELASGSS